MTTINLRKTFSSLPRTTRGQGIVINGDPKGKNFLYCNGSQIFIRNIEDPSICDIYTEHVKDTTVAKYSPSGFYIASGDITGKVRIWDTVNPEHILKNEVPALGGVVKDLDWSSDNGKIVVAGDGSPFARVFTYDTGNSAGDLSGHTKCINSVSMKPSRPFKIVSGSEDFCAMFFEGPPFKFVQSIRDASNFVNCVRYAPNGEYFIVGGSDGKLWMYDGKTAEKIGELGEPKAHKGSIYAFSVSADSKKVLSVSGDKTAKVWDVDSKTCETEFVMGKDINDMQVGCLWQGDHLITISLSGHINYLDQSNPQQPKKIVKGHNKPLTALAVKADGSGFYSGSSDGKVVEWDVATSNNEDFKGKGHTNQVTDMIVDGEYLVSVGMDDTIRFSKAASQEFGQSVKVDSQPQALDSRNGITVVACMNHVCVFEAPGKKLSSLDIKDRPFSVSIHPNGNEVAVGAEKYFTTYSLNNGILTVGKQEESDGFVTALAYSPDGSSLGAANDKLVKMYDTSTWKELTGNWSSQHTARVTCLSWSPDSRRMMSGSLDSHICVWQRDSLKSKTAVRSHPVSHPNKLKWLDNHTVVTVGQDSNVKIWDVSE